MSDPALALAGIDKGYNRGKPAEVIVLRGATLTVGRGEVVALVAPSGAGKSTLLHIAGLLDTADAGSVRLDGREMGGLPDRARTEARRAEVGFIYQFHHLLPEFSALENVAIPQLANGQPRAAAEARAQELLGRVGVGNRTGHRPAALSGGEQQRVAFCRALANAPKLLLADEPTGNLDSNTAREIMSLLIGLHAEGLTLIIVTHDPGIASHCHRVVRLHDGRIAEDFVQQPARSDAGFDHTVRHVEVRH
ncbi:MAG: ABC transporter ATP-binding protein [Tabrizicola sp.]|nr:ABC transporter ATP-binding protein [Tabrizicola sp.]